MADATTAAAPAASTGIPVGGTLPGTTIPIPKGTGIETLTAITPPFRNNAPPWYGNGIWADLGCAVPQPGRYLQTSNQKIYELVNIVGRELFDVMWKYKDRKVESFPTYPCLYRVYQMLVWARKRLADNTVADNAIPLLPTHVNGALKMFNVFPVPLYGRMGCLNPWLEETCSMTLNFLSEAMQHTDNDLAYHWTQNFAQTLYGNIKYMMVNVATRFFGVDLATASVDGYTIPDTVWTTYNPSKYGVSTEGTATRPAPGYDPTDLDLEPIRGLPIQAVVPLLQPWPDSRLIYSSGGVWGPQGALNNPATAPGNTNNPASSVNAPMSIFANPNAPPTAASVAATPAS